MENCNTREFQVDTHPDGLEVLGLDPDDDLLCAHDLTGGEDVDAAAVAGLGVLALDEPLDHIPGHQTPIHELEPGLGNDLLLALWVPSDPDRALGHLAPVLVVGVFGFLVRGHELGVLDHQAKLEDAALGDAIDLKDCH